MIQIGKCEALYLLILDLPDPGAPAIGRPGGKPGVQQTGYQRQQGADSHINALLQNIRDIVVFYPYIN